MITVGTMGLHQVEATDPMEPYFVGGEHSQDVARISSHDHSGGLLGAPVAVTIPDGSITAADLDPSVLAPYSLTDGSKPFTGQVTMGADAVVRDALRFGEQGTALAPDATLARTGPGALRADTHLGVGVTPAAWGASLRALQVGTTSALWDNSSGTTLLSNNTYSDGAVNRALTAGAGGRFLLSGGGVSFDSAASVAAGAAQTLTTRAALSAGGTLTLTPEAGAAALLGTNGAELLLGQTGVMTRLRGTFVTVDAQTGNALSPERDNVISAGLPSYRFTFVAAVAGTINTSDVTAKTGIALLDSAACVEAVKTTDWVSFAYLPPPYQEPPLQEGQEPEERQRQVDESKVAHARMLQETAPARHQRGYVLGSDQYHTAELFGLEDRASASPGSDIGTLGAALREVIRRLELLEAAP